MKISDYVVNFVARHVEHVFGVCGGGNMHLIDSAGRTEDVQFVAMHHEQAAAMAAEAYSRLRGFGCALVTSGPGGTNAITGVACAWVDSIPVLFLSGQVTRDTMMGGDWIRQKGVQESDIVMMDGLGVRQLGVQESGIVQMVGSVTKYATVVRDPTRIRYELEKAAHIARSGRPGPVWLDIPVDVQAMQIDPETLVGYRPDDDSLVHDDGDVDRVVSMLQQAKRPVLIVGNGIRLAGGEYVLRLLVDRLQVPVVSSWTGADMIGDHDCHIGHCGIFGDRASNFAVQNADLILAIGCRLSIPQIGSKPEWFARDAKLIMVDVDIAEIRKTTLRVDLGIVADAKWFITALLERAQYHPSDYVMRCLAWRAKYPVVLPEYAAQDKVNSYYFVQELCRALDEDATVVLDMGTAFTGTYQAAQMKRGQRWITASGHAPMGYALPGAIGAAFATGKKVICIVGDGALQMNIQELATIRHHDLPIIIFVLNNGGYLTMRHTQQWHFGKFVGISPESGLEFPLTLRIAEAYEIEGVSFIRHETEQTFGPETAALAPGPVIVELMMAEDQPQIPRERPRKSPDGTSTPSPLHDMFPFLPAAELAEQMVDEIPYGGPGGEGP